MVNLEFTDKELGLMASGLHLWAETRREIWGDDAESKKAESLSNRIFDALYERKYGG